MIPGFLITWVTFPGVIVHELAHALMCRLFGLKIYAIRYFQLTTKWGAPAGYVVHEPADKAWQDMMVGVGPFLVNSIVGAAIAGPAAIPVLRFHGGDVIDYFLMWLGVSIAMHAFPSVGDASSIWRSITSDRSSGLTKAIGIPVVGLIYVGSLGSIFWLDLLYGIGAAGFVPEVLVRALAG